MCIANLPPSSADLLYEGYPSFPVIMLDINDRGYRSKRYPLSFMVNLDSVYCKVHVSCFSSQLHTNPYRCRHRVFQCALHGRFRLKCFCRKARLISVHVEILSSAISLNASAAYRENTCCDDMPIYLRLLRKFGIA
ncbi:unnamed protein product [Onchocerca ochengi]|uniref:SWIM-type domain-containing protein n=1 Tax=Onchocerca ochengi TaxID=42157 RepID=A0A182EGM7_ONCOC|nr:unnamed protein product [Onchocerca ochengi]